MTGCIRAHNQHGMRVPEDVIMRALAELEPSMHDMLLRCLVQHAYGRMTDADVESLLRSVAWQSPSMRAYQAQMDFYDALHHVPEVLTPEDMATLLEVSTLSLR